MAWDLNSSRKMLFLESISNLSSPPQKPCQMDEILVGREVTCEMPCLLGPSAEGKHTGKLTSASLDGSASVLHRCRSVHLPLRRIDVSDLRLEQRMVPRQMLEVRQCPGESGQGSLDACLRKTSHAEQSWGCKREWRINRVSSQLSDIMSSLGGGEVKNEF